MSERLELPSATKLIKDALGTGYGLVEHNKRTVAEICFDRHKIFSAYIEDSDREGAVDWALDQYWANLRRASARGTDVHTVAEALALGAVVEFDPAIQPYVDQYRRFLEDFQPEFLLAEAPVYNVTSSYAGTLDGVARITGQGTVVLDIKTTAHGPNAKTAKGYPKSRPPFPEVALQLTLYGRAESVGLLAERLETKRGRYYVLEPSTHTEPMLETDGGICVVVSPEDYLVHEIDTSDRVWEACEHMLWMARYQTGLAKKVVGRPLAPPTLVVPGQTSLLDEEEAA